jgi:hypothetical protein
MGSGQRELPPAKEVAVLRKFISTEEQSALLQWAEDEFAGNRLKISPAGPNRYFARYDESDPVPDLFWQVRRRAYRPFR